MNFFKELQEGLIKALLRRDCQDTMSIYNLHVAFVRTHHLNRGPKHLDKPIIQIPGLPKPRAPIV